jgi:hypothetical protein
MMNFARMKYNTDKAASSDEREDLHLVSFAFALARELIHDTLLSMWRREVAPLVEEEPDE